MLTGVRSAISIVDQLHAASHFFFKNPLVSWPVLSRFHHPFPIRRAQPTCPNNGTISRLQTGRIESSVNLGPWGIPTHTLYRSICPRHVIRQTLLETHLNGKPLSVKHRAPLGLLVPVELGQRTSRRLRGLAKPGDEPADYRAKRGYPSYDGI